MSAATKADYWRKLKEIDAPFTMSYRDYTLQELRALWDKLSGDADASDDDVAQGQESVHQYAAEQAYQARSEEEPVRVDPDTGFIWYREEVRKPSTPMPRARRKLTYIDSGVEKMNVVDGRYTETVEVPGNRQLRSEVRITMPSYQVGVYKDPALPFKVHIYNGVKGFDLFDVQKFYGGADLVPMTIKTLYVANDLCYDIRTTIRTIQDEHRRLELTGRI